LKNRLRLQELVGGGRIRELLDSTVEQIDRQAVSLRCGTESILLDNDAVIVCAGGMLPTEFLNATGIGMETKFGTV
jgi:thioredoxin reductase (NADPH)